MQSRRRSQVGLSYAEVLVAVMLVGLSLGPALDAVSGGVRGAVVHAETASLHYRAAGRLEEVLALSFSALDAEAQAVANPAVATSFSDPVSTPDRRIVYLSRYDADNADADNNRFTGGEDGLLWVRVEIEGTAHVLEALTSR